MNAELLHFDIQRNRVRDYFYWSQVLMLAVMGLFTLGITLVLAIVYALTIGRWFTGLQTDALDYWLDGTTLRVNQGVLFLRRKAIPLDRVTDVVLAQGPVLRYFGLWQLNVQTAGMGAQTSEAILYGLVDPERVRNEMLVVRDTAARQRA
ncbi:PH domain-containing protein [Aeoliella sp. ICT_H6.2]|uniref:PH domain-containing protein n=1 Tax=Aeoliella straminimaris TaxID=2954799 RepID=A0A9X2FH96_9BACT|nr:PH domain-containing protein [Aeoliella straminimaris]MCO6046669.1 PH domain-containing protein [Aeoliella straminimaris]